MVDTGDGGRWTKQVQLRHPNQGYPWWCWISPPPYYGGGGGGAGGAGQMELSHEVVLVDLVFKVTAGQVQHWHGGVGATNPGGGGITLLVGGGAGGSPAASKRCW